MEVDFVKERHKCYLTKPQFLLLGTLFLFEYARSSIIIFQIDKACGLKTCPQHISVQLKIDRVINSQTVRCIDASAIKSANSLVK